MDGAEGVFDQALTNGLAAIVAADWPGSELWTDDKLHAVSGLLAAIKERGAASGGIVRVLRPGENKWLTVTFDDQPVPNFTEVDIDTLKDAIDATQATRHARDGGRARLKRD
jgi:DNA-binding protein YbaB